MKNSFMFRGQKYETGQVITAATMLLPNLILLAIFLVWPIIQVFYMSFTNWDLVKGTKDFIGLSNYKYLLHDENFFKALLNTFSYSTIKLSLDVVLSLFIAVLLDRNIPIRRYLRTVYFAPVVVPVVASSLIWIWFYDPGIGPLNQILTAFGLSPSEWLHGESTALLSIVIFSVWKGLGYNIILFLAGLQSIPETYIEAAKIDGANDIQTFFKIKLPLLSPVMFFVVMMGIINSFKVFTEISVMTPEGGPLYSTAVMVFYIYEQAFVRSRMGRAGAASVILFLIVLTLTLIQKQIGKKTVNYD